MRRLAVLWTLLSDPFVWLMILAVLIGVWSIGREPWRDVTPAAELVNE